MGEYERKQLKRIIDNSLFQNKQLKKHMNISTDLFSTKLSRQLVRINTNDKVFQLRSYKDLGLDIIKRIRSDWQIEPGNIKGDVIRTNGESYANRAYFQKLRIAKGLTTWSKDNIAKRATISRCLHAANCDEYGDLAFAELCKRNVGAIIAIEQQPGHTYAITYDSELVDPKDHTIVDPWVGRAEDRGSAESYYTNPKRNIVVKKNADGAEWFTPDFFEDALILNPETEHEQNRTTGLEKAKNNELLTLNEYDN